MSTLTLPQTGAGTRHTNRILVALAFFSIYVIWGSTYLAIRYAVETIPPLFTAGVRHLTAGGVLLLWALWRGMRPSAAQWRASFVLGFLFFLMGHGTLHWAEKTVPSGVASLLIATEPMVVALLIAVTATKRWPSARVIGGLVLGLIGVALLMRPEAVAQSGGNMLGLFAVLVSSISWSAGIVYSRQSKLAGEPLMMTTLSLLAGSVLLLMAGFIIGEHRDFHMSDVTARSIWGLVFLIVFGSIVAFTAYNWLLERFQPTLVATHTYVNPIVAILLGWAFAGESLTVSLWIATALVISAIVLVHGAESVS
jgi:drug/metabolite transporter (DMT)-like permease